MPTATYPKPKESPENTLLDRLKKTRSLSIFCSCRNVYAQKFLREIEKYFDFQIFHLFPLEGIRPETFIRPSKEFPDAENVLIISTQQEVDAFLTSGTLQRVVDTSGIRIFYYQTQPEPPVLMLCTPNSPPVLVH